MYMYALVRGSCCFERGDEEAFLFQTLAKIFHELQEKRISLRDGS